MPEPASRVVLDPDRHGRRAVWIAWFCTMLGAAIVYAGKANDGRSAFIRWRHQVIDFWQGVNIWDKYYFPNPPILPITLTPLMWLPEVSGAMTWFVLKVALVSISIWLCFRMVNASGKVLPSWIQGAAILLSLRPIMSDLHHGNNNLLILALIVFCLYAWRKGYDVLAGLMLALAITYKVTPALFLPYFIYKRSWRTVGATFLGIGLFLLVVPSVILGPGFNGQCLAMWWHRIMSPFVAGDNSSPQEPNQSMIGALARLLTAPGKQDAYRYGRSGFNGNILALSPKFVATLSKALSVGFVAILAFACRTNAKRRDDARMLGEFSLIVLVMLFASERSWKHHFVTLLLPYTYLVYRGFLAPVTPRVRTIVGGALVLSALLILSTSTEVGGNFFDHKGHKIAQFYGMFFWSGLVLFIATAWRVKADGGFAVDPAEPTHQIPPPHIRAESRTPASLET